jgi:hypothetical protein
MICTPSPAGVRGGPILAGNSERTDVTHFDP